LIARTENGLFRSGRSLFHRLDPRIKVLSSLTLVVLSFAANTWGQLAVLIVVAAAALWVISAHAFLALRICLMLRWLLLFTFLMHLLLSPGRTLWGLGWLSLDGLQLGGFVCLQMALAAIFTTILAITTSIDDLAAAFGWFVRPLSAFGCRTDEWQKILVLALGFIPVVREEMHLSGKSDTASPAESDGRGKRRWSAFFSKTGVFIERMLTRGDKMAYEIVAEDSSRQTSNKRPSREPLSLLDRCFLGAMTLVIVCHWLAG
jgi:energy-coupling factor transport system permease protein